MSYYLYDSRGFVGDLASIHGLFEMREFLCGQDPVFDVFFDLGYSQDLARLILALSVTESDDYVIDDTIVNLRNQLVKCRDIAIINDAVETEEDVARRKEVKKKYALPRGKRHDEETRCLRALELYRPHGRKAQDYVHNELTNAAKEEDAQLTRGTHPFDLIAENAAIDVVILLPDGI